MSEHYDFHYQPTGSGAISGQQVLQQTEDAINELGDYVNDNVGGAMDVAQQALETAQTAETNAQTALDTANSFSGAIQSAQQDASTALSTAQTAQNTASNANNTAVQASQDASSAVTTANNASGQVSTLSGTVTALGQRVTTAEGNIGQNTSDITALTTRVGTAEGNITTLQNDVSIAQGNASSAMATAGTVKQQAYVFRYSSTALVDSSTNSNALLDNTDNLKVGDKVIDSSGVLFSITAIDTANSTFTVGSALIDLALDANVVHTSGNETISGAKTFSDTATFVSVNLEDIRWKSLVNQTVDLNDCYVPKAGTISGYYTTDISSGANISNKATNTAFTMISLTTRRVSASDYQVRQVFYGSGAKYIRTCSNGTWTAWINETDKYVTTDTNQTISGTKDFADILRIYNSLVSGNVAELSLINQKVLRGSTSETGEQFIQFYDKILSRIARISTNISSNGSTQLAFYAYNNDANNQLISSYLSLIKYKNGDCILLPYPNDNVALGTSTYKYKDLYTSKVNNLEPSSLSLPDIDNRIDISSYVTNLTNVNNEYTPPVNGWICVRSGNATKISILDAGTNIGNGSISNSATYLTVMTPCIANKKVYINVICTSLSFAVFIPCMGNV